MCLGSVLEAAALHVKKKNEIRKLFLHPPLLFPHPRCLFSFRWLLEVFNGRESIAREHVLSANLLVCCCWFFFPLCSWIAVVLILQ